MSDLGNKPETGNQGESEASDNEGSVESETGSEREVEEYEPTADERAIEQYNETLDAGDYDGLDARRKDPRFNGRYLVG